MEKLGTVLEKHHIGGQGNLLSFVDKSKEYGKWSCQEGDLMRLLKSIAECEDQEGRKLALTLYRKIELLVNDGVELRKRFDTTGKALTKINSTLKEQLNNENK